MKKLLPGLLLAFCLAWGAKLLAVQLGEALLAAQGIDPVGASSPISAIPVAVILGLVLGNGFALPALLRPGFQVAQKDVLRLGIVLVGIKLSLLDVAKVGMVGVPAVILLVGFAVGSTLLLARWLGVGTRLALLAAASTSICGITATLAVAPTIDADDREVAYTVANVTLFGLLAMIAYPYLAHGLLGQTPSAAGLFLGTAIHDTAQVMGAAIAYREMFGEARVLEVATVAKLTRNLCLLLVVPILATLYRRQNGGGERAQGGGLFPRFVLGFLALATFRTVGELGLADGGLAMGVWTGEAWKAGIRFTGDTAATLALATALASVGLSTRLSILKGLGVRPFLLGMGAALLVGGVAFGMAVVLGPLLGK